MTTPISGLPAGATPADADRLPVVQGTTTNRVTVKQLRDAAPQSFGKVALDSFSGIDDDAKLTAAMDYASAQTYPPTIMLSNRQHSFATVNRVAYDGLRIEGPAGYGNPERLTQTKMPGRVALSGTGPWFVNPLNTSVYSCSFRNLSFTGGSNAYVIGQNGTGTWYCLQMVGMFSSGLSSFVGSQATKVLLTAADWHGAWQINNSYNGAFHIGGSDNVLWSDGGLFDSGSAYAGDGQYHIWLDFMEKSTVGPVYVTTQLTWAAMKISGQTSPSTDVGTNTGGPIDLMGPRLEGRNKDEGCYGALLRVEGGIVNVHGGIINYGMVDPAHASFASHSPADAGVIHHSGGVLDVDGTTYDRATGVAETVPFVYTNTAGDCMVTKVKRASKGGAWTGRPRVTKPTANAENRLITDASITLATV